MTPGARRILEDLRDAGDDGEIAIDGLSVLVGERRTHWRPIRELLRLCALKEVVFGASRIYVLNETGAALLRRPELDDEVHVALLRGRPFTILKDRVVRMSRRGAMP